MSHRPEQARVRTQRPVKASQLEKLDQQHAKNNAKANSLANLKSARRPPRTK
jgi:hypothetical protein